MNAWSCQDHKEDLRQQIDNLIQPTPQKVTLKQPVLKFGCLHAEGCFHSEQTIKTVKKNIFVFKKENFLQKQSSAIAVMQNETL